MLCFVLRKKLHIKKELRSLTPKIKFMPFQTLPKSLQKKNLNRKKFTKFMFFIQSTKQQLH